MMKKIWLSILDAMEVFFLGEITHPGLAMMRLFAWIVIIYLFCKAVKGFFWVLIKIFDRPTQFKGQMIIPTPKLPKAVNRYLANTDGGYIVDTLNKDPWEFVDLSENQVEIHALSPEHAHDKLKQYLSDLSNGCERKTTI